MPGATRGGPQVWGDQLTEGSGGGLGEAWVFVRLLGRSVAPCVGTGGRGRSSEASCGRTAARSEPEGREGKGAGKGRAWLVD